MLPKTFPKLAIFIVCLLVAIILSINLVSVADETAWVNAGQDFYQAVAEFNPEGTYIPAVSHRLGVTILWVSAFIYGLFGNLSVDQLLVIHRTFFLLINLTVFGLALKILGSYTKGSFLIIFILYIFLHRYFPFLGRSSWLDQLLVSFGFLSTIFWIKYLEKRTKSLIFYTSFFTGLVLLTKYAGWLFLVILISLTFFYSIKFKKSFKNLIIPLINVLVLSFLIFVLFYPVMWVDPYKALFLRLSEPKPPVTQVVTIWEYLKEFRLLDPVLIFGLVFVIKDWSKKVDNFLYLVGLTGTLYVLFYILTIVGLFFTGKLNLPFLEGIYRYTIPAILPLALYTFYRLPAYFPNRTYKLIILALFLREVAFSPLFPF